MKRFPKRVETNNDQIAEVRYSSQHNSTTNFANNKVKTENQFLQNFTNLNRNDTDDLLMKAYLHREGVNGKFGFAHHTELDRRAIQFFGLKTGPGPQYFREFTGSKKCYGMYGEN
jgi:hypothetical protein